MQIWESIIIALQALTTNKLRTILTMLGIIIGVMAVITLVAIGNGFRQQINDELGSLGSNVLTIYSGHGSKGGFGGSDETETADLKEKAVEPLTIRDADALSDPFQVSNVIAVAPTYNVGNISQGVTRGQEQAGEAEVIGVSPAYASVRSISTELGQFISQQDVDQRARVVVLGFNVAESLFESFEYPVGEMVRINGVSFEVVGVLPQSGQGGFGNPDNEVLIPLSTAQTRLGKARAFRGSLMVSLIFLQVDTQENMDAVSDQTTAVLRELHRLGDEYADDFGIFNQAQLLEFGNTIATALTAFLGSIAGVSLLVGGIGIMNIMLVSVTERTREIGIRKAVGARRRDILLQFLTEAMVISLLGGFIGIGLGYGASQALNLLIPDMSNAIVTLDSILLATSFSAAIGLFFGVYPAMQAARLRPIDALRYE